MELQPTRVFEIVDVNVELPKIGTDVFTFNEKDKWESQCYLGERSKWYNSWDMPNPTECFPTHWLKETNDKYLLSKEELEEEYNSFLSFLDKEIELQISDKKTIERIKWYYETYFKTQNQ